MIDVQGEMKEKGEGSGVQSWVPKDEIMKKIP